MWATRWHIATSTFSPSYGGHWPYIALAGRDAAAATVGLGAGPPCWDTEEIEERERQNGWKNKREIYNLLMNGSHVLKIRTGGNSHAGGSTSM